MDLGTAKRIAIVGNSGAGKSTLSKVLGEHLHKDVFSIDRIYWLPGWKRRSQKSYKSKHDNWLSRSSWVIEGVGYWNEMKERIAKADIVIFLDVPVDICKERAEIRIEEEKLAPNRNVTAGCSYAEARDRQMEIIEYFHHSLRPRLVTLLSEMNPENVIVIGDSFELELGEER